MYRNRTINKTLNVDNLNQHQFMKEKRLHANLSCGWDTSTPYKTGALLFSKANLARAASLFSGCKIDSSWVVLAFLRLFRNLQKRW